MKDFVLGTCLLRLFIADSNSLKDKRRVLKSVSERIRNKYNVSVAEVGDNDLWQSAYIGIACLANDQNFVSQVLNKIVDELDNNPQLRLLDVQQSIQ